MNRATIDILLERAIEAADTEPVAVRARLALASKALQDGRRDDVAEHLRVAFELADADDVTAPIGNARQLVQGDVRGETA